MTTKAGKELAAAFGIGIIGVLAVQLWQGKLSYQLLALWIAAFIWILPLLILGEQIVLKRLKFSEDKDEDTAARMLILCIPIFVLLGIVNFASRFFFSLFNS